MAAIIVAVLLVPKLLLGNDRLEALLRGAGVPVEDSVLCRLSVRRSRASGPRVPKQSLGTRARGQDEGRLEACPTESGWPGTVTVGKNPRRAVSRSPLLEGPS